MFGIQLVYDSESGTIATIGAHSDIDSRIDYGAIQGSQEFGGSPYPMRDDIIPGRGQYIHDLDHNSTITWQNPFRIERLFAVCDDLPFLFGLVY